MNNISKKEKKSFSPKHHTLVMPVPLANEHFFCPVLWKAQRQTLEELTSWNWYWLIPFVSLCENLKLYKSIIFNICSVHLKLVYLYFWEQDTQDNNEATFLPWKYFFFTWFYYIHVFIDSFRGEALSDENGHHEYELHTGRYMYGISNVLL